MCIRDRHLLLFKKFLVRTDNSALTFLHRMKLNRGVYSRWYELIANFDFDITHRPGKQNVFADALSRMTNHPEDEDRAQDNREQDLLDIYNVYHDLCNAVEDDEEEEEEFSCHQVSMQTCHPGGPSPGTRSPPRPPTTPRSGS